MIIGIDHGYYAMKTKQVCFPTGLMRYTYEPYTMQNVLQYGGVYYVCGTGRQTLVKDKTANDNYYLLTLAALAQEIRKRKGERTAKVVLAAGLPLAGFGREKQKFKEYLFRKEQPVRFFYEGERYEIQIEDVKLFPQAGLPLAGFGREKQKFKEYLFRKEQPVRFFYEGERYEIQIEDVKLFPQGYSALALYPEYLKDEPSVLLVDIGGWTVDLMRLDNAVPNAATCRSLELGVIRCIDEILEQVRRNTGLSITETQVERILQGKSCSMPAEVVSLIEKQGRLYIEKILSAVRRNTGLSITETQVERILQGKSCSMPAEVVSLIEKQGRLYIEKILSAITEAGFDLRAVPSIFMGGGAAIFQHRVSTQDRLCRPIYLTDIHANAAGYELIVGQMRAL